MKTLTKILVTAAIVLLAAGILAWRYWDYVVNPWTRDGQVRAQVVQVAPQVSGAIVRLAIEDNQFVSAGELLFQIDPRPFETELEQARANLEQARDEIASLGQQVEVARARIALADAAIAQVTSSLAGLQARVEETEADVARAEELVARGNVSVRRTEQAVADYNVAVANLNEAQGRLSQANAQKLEAQAALAQAVANLGAEGEQNARLRAARAAVFEAELDLEYTQVRAPVDGHVTNLTLRIGSQAVANQPVLALVDVNSFWVHGFFRETVVGEIRPGNRAVVTLMSYPDTPLEGRVDSIGWGIAQQDGSTGQDLLPTVSPTFEWIRLAQRVPVRIHLRDVPEEVALRVGTTASVLVMTGTTAEDGGEPVAAAPRFLQ
jgi:multidrug resistance efflux pump